MLRDWMIAAREEFGDIVTEVVPVHRRSQVLEKIRLYLRDGTFADVWVNEQGTRWSFHWEQRAKRGLIYRYDNAPDHPEVATFPRHFHDGSEMVVRDDDLSDDLGQAFCEFLSFIPFFLRNDPIQCVGATLAVALGRCKTCPYQSSHFQLQMVVSVRSSKRLASDLAESLVCGVPVVASRLGAMAGIVEDGVAGLLFKSSNPEDLAAKVRWMVENEEATREMGWNAREARRMLEEAVGLSLEEAERMGTLEDILQESGYGREEYVGSPAPIDPKTQ